MGNYVNKEELLQHLIQRRKKIEDAKAAGIEPPSLQDDNYLGKVIYDIANNLAYRPNFISYSFRNDMIGDAIENLVRVIDNFDPKKSNQPFGYLTTIAWYAMVRRIQMEDRQQKIKGAIISEILVDELFDTQEIDDDGISYKTHFIDYLRENSFIGADDTTIKPQKLMKEIELSGLELFYEGVDPVASDVEEML